MIKKQLGQRIAVLRRVQKMSQERLAESSGYSVDFISLVERGINAPSLEGCERIAKALKLKTKDLFDFEEQ